MIDSISMSSVFLTAKRIYNDTMEHSSQSKMSGFFWNHNNQDYLITNWHNVTGINPDTGKNIGTFTPSHLELSFKHFAAIPSHPLPQVFFSKLEIPLFDASDTKIWLEHSTGKKIDVVIVPLLDRLKELNIAYTNGQNYESTYLPFIGDDCFIVGYPEGITGPAHTPIWKRGSVASIPKMNYDDKPMFLVDTIGNSGLSGSPVIGKGTGMHNRNGVINNNTVIGSWQNFWGIYSGRISTKGIGSQLGRVWRAEVINEIFVHNDL
jgi:hypothetical protein